MNVVLDTLRGAKTAKIRQYRMDEVPQYGQFAKVPAYRMRQVLNYLLMHDYLSVTDDTYAILQLTEKIRAASRSGTAGRTWPASYENGKGAGQGTEGICRYKG